MTKRKIVREMVDDVSNYEFEGKLSSVLERVQQLIDRHGADARLDYNPHFYYDYDNEPSPRYELYIDREENDIEFERRRTLERDLTEAQEARDKAEFERLAKKFGQFPGWNIVDPGPAPTKEIQDARNGVLDGTL